MYLRKSAIALMASAALLAPSNASAFDWGKLWWPSKPLSPLERANPQNKVEPAKAQPAVVKPAATAAAKVVKVADTPYSHVLIRSNNPDKTNTTVRQVNDTAVKIMTSVDGRIKETSRAASQAVDNVSKQNKKTEEQIRQMIRAVEDKINRVTVSANTAARFNTPSSKPAAVSPTAEQKQAVEKVTLSGQDFAEKTAAVGVALASLRFDELPNRVSVSIGSGSFNRKTALAVGVGYTSNDSRMRVNVSLATNGSQYAVGMGFAYSFSMPR